MPILSLYLAVPSASENHHFKAKLLLFKYLLLVNLEPKDKGEKLEKKENQSEEVICSNRRLLLSKWVVEHTMLLNGYCC